MKAPSPNPVTLKFGATTPPYTMTSPHIGTDYSYNPDHNVRAVDDGDVTIIRWDGKTREGNMIVHTLGNRRWAYCHLSLFGVTNGPIKKGQLLGVMGDTGFAFGKHLHIGMRIDGKLVDFEKYITEPFGSPGDTMQPTAKQVGDIYKAMTGNDISQKDLDFYITPPRTVYDLIYALFPATQAERDKVKLLEEDRDKNLYPLIEKLKSGEVTKEKALDYIIKNLK